MTRRPVFIRNELPDPAQRQRCPMCDKPLRPRLQTIAEFKAGEDALPAAEAAAAKAENLHVQVRNIGLNWGTRVEGWDGAYSGYGYRGGVKFCTLNCCRDFALAAHTAGYRIKRP